MSRIFRTALAVLLATALSPFRLSSPRSLQAADETQDRPIAEEMVPAIQEGDLPTLRRLLGKGAVVDGRDEDGNTPLILASLFAGPDCVEMFLKSGADPNAANKAGATALIRAATDYDKTRLLLTAGAKARVRTNLGNTPLLLAARRPGNSKTVKLLLESGADPKAGNATGVTPLLAAAASGDIDSVKLLLDQGADPGHFPELKTPNDGLAAGLRTPLMWAAYHNNLPMIRLLIDRGADANQVIVFGTALSHAAWHNSFEAAELLIARGAKVDIKDPFAGFTPLHWAASSEASSADVVQLLLKHGADPNAVGGEHIGAFGLVPQTPRLIAERRGRTAIVDALIAAGAKEPPAAVVVARPRRSLPEVLDDKALIASTEMALSALQTTATRSRDSFLTHVSRQDCTSCHQQYLPMAAVGHARDRAVRFNRNAAADQIELTKGAKLVFFDPEFIVQTVFHPEPAYGFGYEILGLLAEKIPPSDSTYAALHHLLTIQGADGRWFNNLPRPPMQSSDIGATALAVQALKSYGWSGRRAEFDHSIERASRWLRKTSPDSTDDAVFLLLGLHWAGDPPESLTGVANRLLEKQRSDGGWAQLPKLESDAYATGQALFALSKAVKLPANDARFQRGLRFLLESQEDDGTWRVARRAFPFQPTMNSGFPHHRDSWISAAATSWAVMALTQALPAGPAAGALAVATTTPGSQPSKQPKVDFTKEIQPLLARSCVGCHSGERARGHFLVDSREALLRGGESGTGVVVPGQSGQSLIVDYISGPPGEEEMPPKAARGKFPGLTKAEVDLLRTWIDQGAE